MNIKFFSILLILFLGSSCASNSKEVKPVVESKVLETYDQVIDLMNKHYFDANYGGLNWPEETQKTRELLLSANDDSERYGHIKSLFSNLKHSHLVFQPATSKEEKKSIPYGSPKNIDFDAEIVENAWVITKVKSGSAAAKAGLKMGMNLVKLNDWPVDEYFSSSDLMDYYMLRNTLHYYPKNKMTLTVLDQNSEEKVISFDLKKYSGSYQKMGLIRDPSEFEQKILPGNIGYVRFSIFLVDPVREAIEAIKELRDKKVRGMIVDLRNNPGGVGVLSSAIAKEFCSENYNLGTQTGRDMTLKFPVFAQSKPYKGKVVFLLNKNSASTSEVLAAGMQANKGIKVVGEVSAGMALPSVMISLKDGSVFQYPIADFKTVDNKTVEGVGVLPDVKISHTVKSLNNNKDNYIEAAIKIINKEDSK